MGMSAGAGGGQKVQTSPNVTPMADVMLVLLIIFMIVTPALLAGFNAAPPEAVNLRDHPEDENLDQVLGIDKDGAFYLNKRPVRTEDLPTLIKQIYEARTEDKIMYLKADKDVEYSMIIDALDVAARNGVRVVGMISEQRPGTISTVVGDTKATAPMPVPGGTP